MDMEREWGYNRLRMDSGQHRRILLTAAVLGCLAFLPVAWRLYELMVAQYDYYARQALRNQTRTTAVAADRGTICDRNMNILAANESRTDVYLDPHELKQSRADLDAIAEFLAQTLGQDAGWIREQAADLRMRYRQVGRGVEDDTAAQIRSYITQQSVSGIHLEPAARRIYPYGTLASQVIGFTNASGEGCEGVEAAYDAYLSGSAGKVITTKGSNEMDMPFSVERYLAAGQGCDVILTLDCTVQACLENQLQAAIDRYAVQNGAFGIVMNCKTGEILAMATLGGYDPNAYLEIADPDTAAALEQLRGTEGYADALTAARLKQWRNRVLSDGYEPGSTFKVLTMAAALDCGAITLDTPFYCRGAENIPGRAQLLHCWRAAGHGAEQTPQALQNSCNIAFAHIALKLGGERFYEYITRFGIREKTGIDLSGESRGVFFPEKQIVDTDRWGTASLTSGSFGQTFKITPLQLVRAISSVVNGGELMEPYIVAEVLDARGETVLRQEPTVTRRTIRPETSQVMRGLIRSVVTEGTAKNAQVAGFSIGGKTGTSEKIDVFDASGQRVLDKIVSFVGIAPMEDPTYIVLCALDTPSRETGIYISGGVMAAPTVGAVMAQILPYLGVERDLGAQLSVPELTGLTNREAQKALEDAGLTGRFSGTGDAVLFQIPEAGQTVSPGTQVLVYTQREPPQEPVTIPDFRGMNRAQAAQAAGALALVAVPAGCTELSAGVTVAGQDLPAGQTAPPGTRITLYFADPAARD